MPEETKTKNISKNLLVIAVVVSLLMGAGLGYLLGVGGKEIAFEEGRTQGKKETEDYYKEKMGEVFPSPTRDEITFISGEVVEKNEDTLLVRERWEVNPVEGFETKDWEVRVTNNTGIIRREEISIEELDKLIEEAERTGEELPEPFVETEASLSEIEEGQSVRVEAGENIKGKESFEAEKIILY